MKFVYAMVLLASMLGISVFGAIGTYETMQGHNKSGPCLFAIVSGIDCSRQSSIFDDAMFHLNALKKFSTATISGMGLLLTLIAVLFVVGTSVGLRRRFAYHGVYEASVNDPPNSVILRWLSLHENSPAGA